MKIKIKNRMIVGNSGLRPALGLWYGVSRQIWAVVAALLVLTGVSSCGGEPSAAISPATDVPATATITSPDLPAATAADEVRSDEAQSVSAVGAADLAELVQGNNAFAFDLYRALSDGEGNLFYSPFSISQALAMTSAGARGETQRQMEDTLHHRLPQSSLHPAFNALDRTLASRGQATREHAQQRR